MQKQVQHNALLLSVCLCMYLYHYNCMASCLRYGIQRVACGSVGYFELTCSSSTHQLMDEKPPGSSFAFVLWLWWFVVCSTPY